MRTRLAAVLLSALLLTSCSQITASVEDLLDAPLLNTRQAEVHAALEATMDLSAIVYKYPQSGDYRSPFIFFDLDGDSLEEAIVFYSFRNDNESVRAKVLKETQPGAWYSAYDLSGSGSQVEFVQFAHLLSPDSSCMVIGWQNRHRRSTELGVYSFFDGAFRTELLQGYTHYAVQGVPGGLSEIAVVSEDESTGFYELSLIGKAGTRVARSAVFTLAHGVEAVLQLRYGRLWDGGNAFYVDEMRSDAVVATEIIRRQGGRMESAIPLEDFDSLYAATFRDEAALSEDLDGDGVIETPLLYPLPGQEETGEISPVLMHEYIRLYDFGGEEGPSVGFEIAYRAVFNQAAGYYVFLPEGWVDNVTVVRQSGNDEWRFCKLDPDSGRASTELLRIRRYSTRDYRDQFTENYILLKQKGVYQYYAYIPKTTDEPLAVTEEQVRAMFALL